MNQSETKSIINATKLVITNNNSTYDKKVYIEPGSQEQLLVKGSSTGIVSSEINNLKELGPVSEHQTIGIAETGLFVSYNSSKNQLLASNTRTISAINSVDPWNIIQTFDVSLAACTILKTDMESFGNITTEKFGTRMGIASWDSTLWVLDTDSAVIRGTKVCIYNDEIIFTYDPITFETSLIRKVAGLWSSIQNFNAEFKLLKRFRNELVGIDSDSNIAILDLGGLPTVFYNSEDVLDLDTFNTVHLVARTASNKLIFFSELVPIYQFQFVGAFQLFITDSYFYAIQGTTVNPFFYSTGNIKKVATFNIQASTRVSFLNKLKLAIGDPSFIPTTGTYEDGKIITYVLQEFDLDIPEQDTIEMGTNSVPGIVISSKNLVFMNTPRIITNVFQTTNLSSLSAYIGNFISGKGFINRFFTKQFNALSAVITDIQCTSMTSTTAFTNTIEAFTSMTTPIMNVTNLFNYSNRVFFSIKSTAGQLCGSSSWVKMTTYWNVSTVLTQGPVTYSSGDITVNKLGIYIINAGIGFPVSGSLIRAMLVRQGPTNDVIFNQVANSSIPRLSASAIVQVTALDGVNNLFSVYAFQDTGVTITMEPNTWFRIVEI